MSPPSSLSNGPIFSFKETMPGELSPPPPCQLKASHIDIDEKIEDLRTYWIWEKGRNRSLRFKAK